MVAGVQCVAKEGRSAKCILPQERTAVSKAPEARKSTGRQCPFEFVGLFGLQSRFGVVVISAHVPNARKVALQTERRTASFDSI